MVIQIKKDISWLTYREGVVFHTFTKDTGSIIRKIADTEFSLHGEPLFEEYEKNGASLNEGEGNVLINRLRVVLQNAPPWVRQKLFELENSPTLKDYTKDGMDQS